jgi:AAA domain-containing protein
VPRLDEWKPSDPIQVLVYGKSKIGKSWFGYTFPRVVSFDFDKGIAVARNPEFVKRFGMRDVFYEQFDELKTVKGGVPSAHNAFDDACKYFDEWMKPVGKWKGYETGRDKFDTFLIDSGTTLVEFSLNKAVIVLGAMGTPQSPLSRTHIQGMQHGLIVPKLQDFGAERSLTEQFVDMVRSSGKNVVFICHEKEIYKGEGKDATIEAIVPLLTGKSTEAIPLKFDEVYNLRVKPVGVQTVRYLQTTADSFRKAGSRYGIPNEIEPSYDVLKGHIDRIHAEQQRQAQPAVAVGGVVGVSSTLATGVK